jgi:hypothetical protein
MTEPEYLTNAESLEQAIADALHSPFAKPNQRRFPFVHGVLYAVLKMAWDSQAFEDRPALQWVYIFPPKPGKTGVSWQHDFIGTEQQCREELASITQEEAALYYEKAWADYQG